MALGLCCQWLVIKNGKPKNVLISRNLQLNRFKQGAYSDLKIKQTYIDNLNNLLNLLPVIIMSGIKSFRISSSLFPLYDIVDPKLTENPEIDALLLSIGKIAKTNNLRLTTHPGQFTVLSSDNPNIIKNSIREVEHHAWMFDKMKLDKTPYYSINIHGGKANRSRQLIISINQLSSSARDRLTLENCEFAYTVKELESVYKETGIPICFDSHHHELNNGKISGDDALNISISTWPNTIKPMTHISNTKPDLIGSTQPSKLRQHSDYLYNIPNYQAHALNNDIIDMEIEAKMKNLALFQSMNDFNLKNV